MSPKRQRLWFVILGMGFLAIASALVLNSFRDNLVFFYSPTELAEKPLLAAGKTIRIGGLVKEGSVRHAGDTLLFTVTDLNKMLDVRYNGAPPTLFREGQGVVAEGKLDGNLFMADQVLAKHDEKYMPPEVARAIKQSGHWKGPK